MRRSRFAHPSLVAVIALAGCRGGFDRNPVTAPSPAAGFAITERAESGPVTALAVRHPWLWSAGSAGLRRFDLASGEVEVVVEPPALEADPVTALAVDDEGGGWVATGKQFGRWTPAKGGDLRLEVKGFPGQATVLAAGRPVRSEGVWVGGPKGLQRFDEGRGFLPVEALRGVPITSLDVDADGRTVWVGTRGHGLYRATAERAETIGGTAILLDEIVGTVKTQSGTRIVAGNTGGEGRLYAITMAGPEGFQAGPGQRVLALVERAGDAVLVAGARGAEQPYGLRALGPIEAVPRGAVRWSSLVRDRASRWAAVPLELALPPDMTVAAGGGEHVYAGSARMGVARAARGRAEVLEGSELVGDATRLYLGCFARAQCYVVTDGPRAFRTDGDRYQPASVGEPPSAAVLALATDPSDGALIAVSAEGQPAGLVITKHAADPNAAWQLLHRVAVDLPPKTVPRASFAALSPGGALWVGLHAASGGDEVGVGAIEIDLSNGHVVEHGPPRPNVHLAAEALPLPANLTGIVFDGGATWTSSLAGVSRWGEGQLRTWNENDGFVSESVHALARGTDGAMWAATSAGIVRWDGKEWRAFGSSELAVRGLVVDRKRRTWLATQKGLRVMEPGATDPAAAAVVLDARMRDVVTDGSGRVWAISSGTIVRIDEK